MTFHAREQCADSAELALLPRLKPAAAGLGMDGLPRGADPCEANVDRGSRKAAFETQSLTTRRFGRLCSAWRIAACNFDRRDGGGKSPCEARPPSLRSDTDKDSPLARVRLPATSRMNEIAKQLPDERLWRSRLMKPLNMRQHDLVNLLLRTGPVTIAQLTEKVSRPEHPPVAQANVRAWLSRLVAKGWMIKLKGPQRKRGRALYVYRLVPNAQFAWQQREAEFQAARKEQERQDRELLG
jgi:predicted transcriptional regulator